MGQVLRNIIIAALCLVSLSVDGQEDSAKFDVVNDTSYAWSGKVKKWKFLGGFDARRSFFAGRPVKVNGIRIGIEYKGIHRFGIGVYGLDRDEIFTHIPVNRPDATDTVSLHASFGALFYERVVYGTRRWEVSIPLVFGGGQLRSRYIDTSGVFVPWMSKPFSVLATGVATRYKILKWLAPGLGVGYRFVFNADPEIRGSFQGFYYKFGVSILFGELYRSVFKRKDNE